MSIEERTIELTIISASDLKKVSSWGKQSTYLVAYIHPKQKRTSKKTDDGGTNPTWNQTFSFTHEEQRIQAGGVFITVEIYADGTFSDKLIGSVRIPLSDIAREATAKEEKKGSNGPQFLAFEVHRPSGKTKGLLNVSIQLGEKRTIQLYQNQPPPQMPYGQSSSAPQGVYPGYPQYPQQYGPPPPYGAPAPYGAPPPQFVNQYPQQQAPYYPQQPGPYYPQQPPPYYDQQRGRRGGGGGGLGLGAGLLGGAIGGLLVGDMIGDFDDGGDDNGGDF